MSAASAGLFACLAGASALLLALAHFHGRSAVEVALPALSHTLRWVADDSRSCAWPSSPSVAA